MHLYPKILLVPMAKRVRKMNLRATNAFPIKCYIEWSRPAKNGYSPTKVLIVHSSNLQNGKAKFFLTV